jgi:hypothetical protein
VRAAINSKSKWVKNIQIPKNLQKELNI